MRCVSCGMAIGGNPIREEIEGRVKYYCCLGCFEEELCRRDKPLRVAFGSGGRRARGSREDPAGM